METNATTDVAAAAAAAAILNSGGVIPANISPEQLDKVKALIIAYLKIKVEKLSVVIVITYSVLCILSLALIFYLRRNKSGAHRGDTDAARKTLLPAFEPLLWILAFMNGGFCVYTVIALATNFFPTRLPSLHIECFYAGRQFALLLVIVFMLQKSVTVPALTRAVAITFVLSTYTLPVAWFLERHNDLASIALHYWMQVVSHAILLPLFMYVMVRPPSRSSKAALRRYCMFALTQHTIEIAFYTAFRNWKVDLGFALAYAELAVSALCPFYVWSVLKDDTEHWRGLGQRACALQAVFRQRSKVPEHLSSEGLHVLIELHRKYIIDFAYLELKQRIGVGSSAVVYSGMLKSKTPVAIKVYTPTTVTEDTVGEFSHEAAFCGALNHPNIVRFFGICVSPPTICLVSELCQGSLDVVMSAFAQRQRQQQGMQQKENQQEDQHQLLVTLGYMIDAARAVAYIHSFSPAFVHRDIKPANFLVDAHGNVKLTDFGESRFLPQVSSSRSATGTSSVPGTTRSRISENGSGNATDDTGSSLAGSPSSSDSVRRLMSSPPYVSFEDARSRTSATHKHQRRSLKFLTPKMTVKGTADYMAPEMINGKGGFASYGEAADVYSLAITLWDVLNPEKEKYPGARNNHLRVFESVVAGSRPELDPLLHPGLREVLASSWHQDHWRRPTAQSIVYTLERIQEEVAAALASELHEELESQRVVFSVGDADDETGVGVGDASEAAVLTISGQELVNWMCSRRVTVAPSQGVRIGNMLMDAGLLHHVRHERSFECASDAHFYFDECQIRLYQPLAMLEGGDDADLQRQQRCQKRSWWRQNHQGPVLHPHLQTLDTPAWLGRPIFQSKTFRHRNSSTTSESSTAESNPVSILGRIGFSDTGDSGLSNGDSCVCRQLGQRLQLPSGRPITRFFRRKHMQTSIPEDSVLTAKLLEGSQEQLYQFDFERSSTSDRDNTRESEDYFAAFDESNQENWIV